MKSLFYGIVMMFGYFVLSSSSVTERVIETVQHVTVYDTVKVIEYDTIVKVVNKISDSKKEIPSRTWNNNDIVKMVKYVNTQQRNLNDDNWAVIQVILNRCREHNITMSEYIRSPHIHFEGNFFNLCEAGKIWSYTYNENNPRDAEMYRRVERCLAGNIPDSVLVPPQICCFESHPESWNKFVDRGVFKRKNIWKKFVHEFYWHPKTTEKEKKEWEENLKRLKNQDYILETES